LLAALGVRESEHDNELARQYVGAAQILEFFTDLKIIRKALTKA
jgi:hypothetical protein